MAKHKKVIKKTKYTRMLVVVIIGLLLIAIGTVVICSIQSKVDMKDVGQNLDKLISTKDGPPGALVVVQKDRKIEVRSAGAASIDTKTSIGQDDVTRIASVSKAFSGAVALSTVNAGVLDLDDTIGQKLPDLPKDWHAVTLRQLLNHTSGLPDYIKNPEFIKSLVANPSGSMTPREILGFVSNEKLKFSPGSQYFYSDSDNIVIGLMVEAATGKPYETVLQENVAKPLNLKKTFLPDSLNLPEPYIHGYDPGEPPEDVTRLINPQLAWASGGMVSSAHDLNKFIRAYVNGTLTKTPAAKQDFVPGESGPPGPGKNFAGLGVFRYETACGVVYGHTGNMPGYTAFAVSSADGKNSAVVIVNTQLNSTTNPAAFEALKNLQNSAICAAVK